MIKKIVNILLILQKFFISLTINLKIFSLSSSTINTKQSKHSIKSLNSLSSQ
ncbi:hypothetical protein AAJ76_4100034796 [Vairimorpha ceranae]|uniref:Uncharacterized protein n=1 Tax=Vairimorpha ceranae TaxID=40302 RepID=A0A0F9WDK8_9MICR|nr:hypothetical protein AAJ76_4100034796 [Vairimorpha ceranae]KKO74875.1 hypothetical protein AAJ76_4100034796 [Vairimorpha ceranae]